MDQPQGNVELLGDWMTVKKIGPEALADPISTTHFIPRPNDAIMLTDQEKKMRQNHHAQCLTPIFHIPLLISEPIRQTLAPSTFFLDRAALCSVH